MLTYPRVPGVERNGSSGRGKGGHVCACQQHACVQSSVCVSCVGGRRESAQRDTQARTSKPRQLTTNPYRFSPASRSLISPVLYRVVSLRVVRLLHWKEEEEDEEERLDFSDPDVGAAGGDCWWRRPPPLARISRDARFGWLVRVARMHEG